MPLIQWIRQNLKQTYVEALPETVATPSLGSADGGFLSFNFQNASVSSAVVDPATGVQAFLLYDTSDFIGSSVSLVVGGADVCLLDGFGGFTPSFYGSGQAQPMSALSVANGAFWVSMDTTNAVPHTLTRIDTSGNCTDMKNPDAAGFVKKVIWVASLARYVCSTTTGKIYWSMDPQNWWVLASSQTSVLDLLWDPVRAQVVALLNTTAASVVSLSVSRSSDGKTFGTATLLKNNGGAAAIPGYIAQNQAGALVVVSKDGAAFRSSNGTSWSTISAAFTTDTVFCLTAQIDTFFAGTGTNVNDAAGTGHVWIGSNGGQSWAQASGLATSGGLSLCGAVGDWVAFAGVAGAVYYSLTQGATWLTQALSAASGGAGTGFLATINQVVVAYFAGGGYGYFSPETAGVEALSLVRVHATQALSESAIALAEAQLATMRAHVPLAETVTLSNAIATLVHAFQALAETVTLSEAAAIHTADHVSLSENSGSVSDSLASLDHAHVTPAETVTLSEAVAVLEHAHAALSETVTLSEALAAIARGHVALSESSGSVSDALIAHAACIAGLSETVTLANALTAHVTAHASLSESSGSIADAIAAHMAGHVPLTETVALSEAVAVSLHAIAALAESLSLGNSIAVHAAFLAQLAETMALSEAMAGSDHAGVHLSESLMLTESITVRTTVHVLFSETLALVESLATLAHAAVHVSEASAITESVFALRVVHVALSEAMTITEQVTRHAVHVGRLLLTISDLPQIIVEMDTTPKIEVELAPVLPNYAIEVHANELQVYIELAPIYPTYEIELSTIEDAMIIGNSVRFAATFKGPDRVLFDPETIELVIKKPDQSIVTVAQVSITRESVGLYHYDFVLALVGPYAYSWRSIGVGQEVAVEDTIFVQAALVP